MKSGPKHGNILGIKVTSTNRSKLLNDINLRLDNKEKFYIVTPNPEIVLLANSDWLLKKSIARADFSVPDGVGLKFAYKVFNNEDLEIIKGRELFFDILEIANKRKLKVYLVGGAQGVTEKAITILKFKYKDIQFKTHYNFPRYNINGQPITEFDRKIHKSVLGSMKMFEPDLIFVGFGAPKQEKWIYRNFFRMKALGAMSVGGTFNYLVGEMKLPPVWMSKIGLEWLWRLIQEPSRFRRIYRSTVVFTFKVLVTKLFHYQFKV